MVDPAGERAELQVVAVPAIEKRIFVIRDRQVVLDEDLANLYGVETKRLVEQVKGIQSASLEISCFSSARKRRQL